MKKLLRLLAAVAGAVFLTGCDEKTELEWETPDVWKPDAEVTRTKRLADKKKNPEYARVLSTESAKLGWDRIKRYQRDTDTGRDLYLKMAGSDFNMCWFFDPDNYNSYYGWAVVYGMRAESENASTEVELFLTNSDRMFAMAAEHDIPSDEAAAFHMDWANLCNGLGAFYDQAGEPQKAAQHLDKARLFLEKILKQSPDNGRACFLMSANCFYRKDIPQAKKYAAKAAKHGFAIPDDYRKELDAAK